MVEPQHEASSLYAEGEEPAKVVMMPPWENQKSQIESKLSRSRK